MTWSCSTFSLRSWCSTFSSWLSYWSYQVYRPQMALTSVWSSLTFSSWSLSSIFSPWSSCLTHHAKLSWCHDHPALFSHHYDHPQVSYHNHLVTFSHPAQEVPPSKPSWGGTFWHLHFLILNIMFKHQFHQSSTKSEVPNRRSFGLDFGLFDLSLSIVDKVLENLDISTTIVLSNTIVFPVFMVDHIAFIGYSPLERQ